MKGDKSPEIDDLLPASVREVWRKILDLPEGKVGKKLPPQDELAERLEIGQYKLREAMRVLEQVGMVERRRKVGTILKSLEPSPSSTLVDQIKTHFGMTVRSAILSGQAIQEREGAEVDLVREARAVFEGAVAAQAARLRDSRDLVYMDAAILEMEAARGDLPKWIRADRKFHEAILAAARNPILTAFGEIIVASFAAKDKDAPQKVCEGKFADTIISEHRDIYRYISQGAKAAKKAEDSMYRHIITPKEFQNSPSSVTR